MENKCNKKDLVIKHINNLIFIKNDPFNKILGLEEINSFNSEHFFIILIYCNKDNLYEILFDKDINIQIVLNGNPHYFFLNSLIKDNPDINELDISKKDIQELCKILNNNNLSVLKKIIFSKILMDFIYNYYGYSKGNEFKVIKEKCNNRINECKSYLIQNKLDIIDSDIIDINDNNKSEQFLEEVKSKKLEYIYIQIFISLIKNEHFANENYDFIEKILKDLDFESIPLTDDMGDILLEYFNKKGKKYINNNFKLQIEDLIGKVKNMKKINFYYILLKVILKNNIYIYNLEFLRETIMIIKKSIEKIIKFYIDTSSSRQNNDINEKICFIIETLLDCHFKYFLNKEISYNKRYANKESNNNNESTNLSFGIYNGFLEQIKDINLENISIVFHTNEKNKNQFFQYEIIFSEPNLNKEFTFEVFFNYIQNNSEKNSKISKNFNDIIIFLQNIEKEIKLCFKYKYNLRIEINIKENFNCQYDCQYIVYNPQDLNKILDVYKDSNILSGKELTGFNKLKEEINYKKYENEDYKEYIYLVRKYFEKSKKEIYFKRKISDNVYISVENNNGKKKLIISNIKKKNDLEIELDTDFDFNDICFDISKEDKINISFLGEKSIFIYYSINNHTFNQEFQEIKKNADNSNFISNIKKGYIIHNKDFDKSIKINNSKFALLNNKNKVINFYYINNNINNNNSISDIPFDTISNIPLISSQNSFELIDIKIEDIIYEIFLFGYENGILLAQYKNQKVRTNPKSIKDFDPYCFCLIKKEQENNFITKNKKYLFLLVVGGLDKKNNVGSFRFFEIIYNKNDSLNIDIESFNNIIMISQNNINQEMKSPITSIVELENNLTVISDKKEYKYKIIFT